MPGIYLIQIVGVLVFALFMWGVMTIYHKVKGTEPERMQPEHDPDKEPSLLEKYCNDKKDDNYKIRAQWILDHDANEREARGQKSST